MWKWDSEEEQIRENEWVLFTRGDKNPFTPFFRNAFDPVIGHSWFAYDKSQELLLVRGAVSRAHEYANLTFNVLLMRALNAVGLRSGLSSCCRTCHGEEGSIRADRGWRPWTLPPGRGQEWPTGVLEISHSGTPWKLMSDVHFWLRQADGAVKFVLTMQIDRHSPEITLEKWARRSCPCGLDGPPCREQIITVFKRDERIIVRGGPLVIEFERLFLRSPRTQTERDIRLNDEDLTELATDIWREQGFHSDPDDEEWEEMDD